MERPAIPNANQEGIKTVHERISGVNLRSAFCRDIVKWAMIANKKGLTLDVRLTAGFPEYFFGDGALFVNILTTLLETSIHHTNEGIIQVSLHLEINQESNRLWLTATVDDTGNGLCPTTVGYINGLSSRQIDISHADRLPKKLRRLREICHSAGGKLEINNHTEESCFCDKRGWGNSYLVRLPFTSSACSSSYLGRIIGWPN